MIIYQFMVKNIFIEGFNSLRYSYTCLKTKRAICLL